MRRWGAPCPRCVDGQMFFDPDWKDPFRAHTCLQCGHVSHYVERDGSIQLAGLPAHEWKARYPRDTAKKRLRSA